MSKKESFASYARKNNIRVFLELADEQDDINAEPVYYTFKDKGKVCVGYKYKDKVRTVNAFPFPFFKKPERGKIWFTLKSICNNLGYLNKNKSNKELLLYVSKIYEQKYKKYEYIFDIEEYEQYINEGKETHEDDVFYSYRTYVFDPEYYNLSKSIKCKIMIRHRFKEEVSRNTELVFDAVNELLDTSEFISNKSVSEMTGLHINTVKKYIAVHEDEISKHNKSIYHTDNYNKHLHELCLIEIKEAIKEIKESGIKPTYRMISDATPSAIHRNTISRLDKQYGLL